MHNIPITAPASPIISERLCLLRPIPNFMRPSTTTDGGCRVRNFQVWPCASIGASCFPVYSSDSWRRAAIGQTEGGVLRRYLSGYIIYCYARTFHAVASRNPGGADTKNTRSLPVCLSSLSFILLRRALHCSRSIGTSRVRCDISFFMAKSFPYGVASAPHGIPQARLSTFREAAFRHSADAHTKQLDSCRVVSDRCRSFSEDVL
jgi:hypothetical protein